jgi:hypothetical protein
MRTFTRGVIGAAFALAIVGVAATPAYASTSNAYHCTAALLQCAVPLPSFGGGYVAFSTNFAHESGTVRYAIAKVSNGSDLCGGTMGWVTTKSCTTSYVGAITFIVETYGQVGNISIAG